MTGRERASKTVSRSSRSPGASQRTPGTLVRGVIFSRGAFQREVLAALQPFSPSALAPGVRLGSDLAPQKTTWSPCERLYGRSQPPVMPRPRVPSCSLVRQQQIPGHNFKRKAALYCEGGGARKWGRASLAGSDAGCQKE